MPSTDGTQTEKIALEVLDELLALPPEARVGNLRARTALAAEVIAEVELLLAECDENDGPQPLVEGMADLCVHAYQQAYQQARLIDHFPPGMRLLDQYDLLESIGEGGQSVVYKAYDTRLDRHVAVKIYREIHSPETQRRFNQETSALVGFSHPGIVTVHQRGILDSGEPFLVMQWVEGGTLAERLRKGPLSTSLTFKLASQLGDALQAAHDKGITHLDVKPLNILLQNLPNGNIHPLLVDFGISGRLDSDASSEWTGAAQGTPPYMAPEQMNHRAVPASDQYALATVVYEMLTGEVFSVKRITAGNKCFDNVSVFIRPVLKRALTDKPEDRYPSITIFVAALNATQTRRKFMVAGAFCLLGLPFGLWQYRDRREILASAKSAGPNAVQLMLSSPQPGYLYLLAEKPGGGYRLLFPPPQGEFKTARVEANQHVIVPSQAGSIHIANIEKDAAIWVVWSHDEIAQPLADILAAAKIKPGGSIDGEAAKAITSLLQKSSAGQVAMKGSRLTTDGPMLVKRLGLRDSQFAASASNEISEVFSDDFAILAEARGSGGAPAARPWTDDTYYLGVTLWRDRAVKASDPPHTRAIIFVPNKNVQQEVTPQRISMDTPLIPGDSVQVAVESTRSGYLYIIDREVHRDGHQTSPLLIFPNIDIRGGDNYVQPASQVWIPGNAGRFNIDNSPGLVADELTFLLTQKPLSGIMAKGKNIPLDPALVAQWEARWKTTQTRVEAAQQPDALLTMAEVADMKGTKRLSAQDALPRTLFRVPANAGEPVMVSLRLSRKV